MSIDRKKIGKYFALEKLRNKYSIDGSLEELKKTYKSSLSITDKNTKEFWNEKNITTDPITKTSNPIAYDRHLKISNLIGKNKKYSVLNIGCGSCELEKFIGNKRMQKLDWIGIDISNKSISQAKNKYIGTFKVMDIKKDNIPYKYFDYVVLSEVIEHLHPSQGLRLLKKVNKILKDNGSLIISIPINEGLESMLNKGINPNGHLRVYSESLIKSELKIANFKVERVYKLYAFKNLYKLKTAIAKVILSHSPNNLVILATK